MSTRFSSDLVDLLVPLTFATMAELNRIATDQDLSLTQLRLLGILRHKQPQMSVLGDHLGLKKSTMTGLIDRAERKGLLRRVPSDRDSRVMTIVATERGKSLAGQIHSQVQNVLAPLFSGLSENDEQLFVMLLDKVLAGIDR